MPLWGTSNTNSTVPQYVHAANGEQLNIFAANNGWVYRHQKGGGRFWDEPLVTVNALTNAMSTNCTVEGVFFSNTAAQYVQGANGFVTVVYPEAITVVGVPTLLVQGATTNATASYSAGTGTNQLLFKFVVPAQTQNIFIKGQTITTNSTVTVTTASNASVNAAVLFANAVALAVTTGANTGTANVAVA